jgi:hypothetical protein
MKGDESPIKRGRPGKGITLNSLALELRLKVPPIISSSWEDATRNEQARGYKFIRDAVREACSRICPGDTERMYEDVLRGLEPPPKKVEDTMMRTVSSMIHTLPKMSTQRAALLAAICSSQTREVAQK